jgi:hypothetical protein
MTDEAGGHVAATRRQWDEQLSAWFERSARARWSATEPYWGMWCIPEAARLLRPGGQLVFMAPSTLARMCMPAQGPATDRLARDLFGLHRVVQRGTSGTEYQLFALPHGEWIRLMAADPRDVRKPRIHDGSPSIAPRHTSFRRI